MADMASASASKIYNNVEVGRVPEPKMDLAVSRRTQWKQWMACLSATLSMVAVGTVYGWYTTCISRLQRKDAEVPFTVSEGAWLLSLTVVGSMIGPFIGAAMADTIGRKKTLLISAAYYIIGWIIIIYANSVATFYIARLILGIGVGVSYTTNPMYISEVADVNIRGALGTLIAVNVFTGSLFTCSIGPWVSMRLLTVILLIIPLLFLLTFVWFPESPYYLAAKGRHTEAIDAIAFFKGIRDKNEARGELDIVVRNINENIDTQSFREKLSELRLPNNRRALFIVMGLIVSQQFSGNFITTSYLESLFAETGVATDSHIATIMVLAVSLVSGALSTSTVEKAGRRPLLVTSTLGAATTLSILATYLLLKDKTTVNVSDVNWIPILDVILFQIAYQVGLGTLVNALIGELFPTNVKGIAGATITVTDGILGTTISKLYSVVGESLGTHVVYFFFAVCSLFAFMFVIAFVPETKNKTFAEIQRDLTDTRFRCYRRENNRSSKRFRHSIDDGRSDDRS